MPEIKNVFVKSRMNKDLDARLLPPGEYRDALNVQISKSEGSDVGALENVLGNIIKAEFNSLVGLEAIGYYVDEFNNYIYVFLTDNSTTKFVPSGGGSNHFIYRVNPLSSTGPELLVQGAFLNFSKRYPIYGVNLLEELLFFTDNRNQPRKINVTRAAEDSTYYTTEDQISVAKYSPYSSIRLYEPSDESSVADAYQSTMKDVVSLYMPDGGSAAVTPASSTTTFVISDLNIPFYPATQPSGGTVNLPQNGMSVAYVDSSTEELVDLGTTVGTGSTSTSLVLASAVTIPVGTTTVVFNYNPYYDPYYAGDDAFIEDKFVRFSYRFKFDDGEYSLIAPFTQICYIPKQDGYFLNNKEDEGDQQQAISSTIVEFMENKVNSIGLKIPLPCAKDDLNDLFKVSSIDIIYKESDGASLKVVESVEVDSTFTGTDNIYEYIYIGKKPYKTLPEKEITRVYDTVPVKSLAQEVSGNRVIYANFQNRHTPPAFLDYNVAVSDKSDFDLRTGKAIVDVPGATGSKTIPTTSESGTIEIGSKISWTGSPDDLVVQSVGVGLVNVTQAVTVAAGTALTFDPSSDDKNTTSIIEYPNHSLKTNRGYQVGIVLSDRYGRTSDVILSNNKDTVIVGGQPFSGPSLFSKYITEGVNVKDWPGNSLKVSFNSSIGPLLPDTTTLAPGIYNGDVTDANYNPLGWYSYKIVVQQKEQEYYNVYAAGAIKGDIYDPTLDLNNTYISLINDNINKIPRDLSEVGPQQKTFRSSVELFGRVVNNVIAYDNEGNEQYYPGRKKFTTNSIQTLYDLLDFTPGSTIDTTVEINAFYRAESNPLAAEITTSQASTNQFGVVNAAAAPFETFDNLVVFETQPVESLLDIYYETSSSGLVTELNEAILNEDDGSNSFANFNPTNIFNEGITPGTDVSTDFSLVNNFGLPISVDTSAGDYLIITSIKNTEQEPQGGLEVFNTTNPYFNQIVQVGGATSNLWNFSITNAFVENVYYGPIEGRRVFNVSFESSINGVIETYQEELVLGNLEPIIYEADGTTSAPTPPNVITIDANLDDQILKVNSSDASTISGKNGADETYPNSNTGKDLLQGDWRIISVEGDNSGDVTDQNYFSLNVFPDSTSPDLLSRCNLINNLAGLNPAIPVDNYNVTVQLEDAGPADDDVILRVIFNLNIVNCTTYNVKAGRSSDWDPGDDPAWIVDTKVYFFQVEDAGTGLDGFYGFIPWQSIGQIFPNGNIEINRACAITENYTGFGSSEMEYIQEQVWFYSPNGGYQAVINIINTYLQTDNATENDWDQIGIASGGLDCSEYGFTLQTTQPEGGCPVTFE